MQNTNFESQQNLTRRRFIQQLGIGGVALTVTGCTGTTALNVLSELSSTGGIEVDWAYLIEQMNGGVSHIAAQTKTILGVQLSYTKVYELKDEEADIQAEINRIESGNVNEVDFRVTSGVSESAQEAVLVKAKEKQDLSNDQKQLLSSELKKHHGAVSKAWVGGARVARVLYETRKANRPAATDFEAAGHAVSILVNAPIALNFLNASRSSYEAHAEAFEYEAKVPVPASQRKLNLKPFDIEQA